MEPHQHQMALVLQVKAGLHAPLPSLLVCFCCNTNQPYYNTHTRVTSWRLENPRTVHYLIYCEADEIENSGTVHYLIYCEADEIENSIFFYW